MRHLAIDYGTTTIGLAVSDQLEIAVQPIKPIKNKDLRHSIAMINEIVSTNRIEKIVIGVPIGTTGKETKQTKLTREFAEKLKSSVAVEMDVWNESFSTQAAQDIMRSEKKKKKKMKQMVDSYAAMVILQEYFENNDITKKAL